jgi:stage IV sporulation protein FB
MWTRLEWRRITAAPGFLLLAAVLLYLDQGIGFLKWYLLGAVLHEFGHILAAKVMSGRVERLSLSVAGAELKFSYRKMLSYGEENLVILAGPAVNLLVGAVVGTRIPLLAAANLGIGAFNLLPVMPLDGGRVLSNLLLETLGESVADNVLLVCTGLVSGFLLGFGLILAVNYANVVLLILSVWLLMGSIWKNINFSSK